MPSSTFCLKELSELTNLQKLVNHANKRLCVYVCVCVSVWESLTWHYTPYWTCLLRSFFYISFTKSFFSKIQLTVYDNKRRQIEKFCQQDKLNTIHLDNCEVHLLLKIAKITGEQDFNVTWTAVPTRSDTNYINDRNKYF